MTEEERLRTLNKEGNRKAAKVKGAGKGGTIARMPGEVERKKQLCAIFRLAGYRNSAVAAALGESVKTIEKWFAEPAVQEFYNYILKNFTDAGLALLQQLSIKAIAKLEEIIDEERDNAIVINAIKEVLDRGGFPKESRQRREEHSTRENKTTFGAIPEVAKLRELPVAEQERAAAMIEELQEMLNAESDK